MRVDHSTLNDLSIIEPGEEGTTVFALLDRTRTPAGRVSQRARMRALPDAASLLATQDAVRFLSTKSDAIWSIYGRLDPDRLDRYLALKWEGLTTRSWLARLFERVVLRIRYRDAIREITRGVGTLRSFRENLPLLVSAIGTGPEMLASYARRLTQLADSDPLRQAHRHAKQGSLAHVLRADQLARGKASAVLREMLAILADVDALCALAAATVEHQWCFPEIVEAEGIVELTGLRHPFVSAATANDLEISGYRVLALTGPNMAGKSTLLKAAGIAVYLGHLGCGVPATSARLSRFDALLASLHIRDSLSTARSFYLNEVRRIGDLVNTLESTPRVFAVLDEPFKGTNVHDASDATALLLDGLCAQVASTVLVATHLSSVVRSRSHDALLATRFLSSSADEHGISFDYALRPGVSDQRLGMILLQREGVAPALQSAIERRQRS